MGKVIGQGELCPEGRKELCGLLVCVWERKREGRKMANPQMWQTITNRTTTFCSLCGVLVDPWQDDLTVHPDLNWLNEVRAGESGGGRAEERKRGGVWGGGGRKGLCVEGWAEERGRVRKKIGGKGEGRTHDYHA